MFEGEGWNTIMYAASNASEYETDKIPFMLWATFITFFFAQLFLGILLSMFQEVAPNCADAY